MSPRTITDANLAKMVFAPRQTRSTSSPSKPSASLLEEVETLQNSEMTNGGHSKKTSNDNDENEDDNNENKDNQPAARAPSGGNRPHKTRATVSRSSQEGDSPERIVRRVGRPRKYHKMGPNDDNVSNLKKRSFSKVASPLSDPETPRQAKRQSREFPTKETPPSRMGSRSATRAQQNSPGGSFASDDSDDDDVYNAVDLISESEEEEPKLEKVEERMIIDSEEENDLHLDISLPNSPILHRSELPEFKLADGLFLSDVPFFEEQLSRGEAISAEDVASWNATEAFPRSRSEDRTTSTRKSKPRVRFQDVNTSDSSSSTSDDQIEYFPDLLMEHDRLDVSFRKMVEVDGDEILSGGSDGSGSYWDFRGSDDFELRSPGAVQTKDYVDSAGSSGSSGSSSGYETDDGDTTDEDLPPPPTITRTRSVLRRPSTSSIDGDACNIASFRRAMRPPPSRRFGPSLCSWVADPSKPIAVIDSTGKRMLIIPAKKSVDPSVDSFGFASSSASTTANTSPQTPFARLHEDSDNERSDSSGQGVPIAGSGANLMMGGLLRGAPGTEFIRGGHVLGPPEAFYPFTSISADGILEDYDDDGEDDENLWDVNDLIDFGDGSSSSDGDDGPGSLFPISAASSPPATVGSPTERSPAQQQDLAKADIAASRMLKHLDRGVVTAFKRDQHRHKFLIDRYQNRLLYPIPTLTAFERNAIKGGRLAAANAPISPIRKQRAGRMFPRISHPLTQNFVPRRAAGHQRSKSMF